LKPEKQFIGMALCTTDCNCTFLTLSAQYNDAPKENKTELINKHTGLEILQLLSKLKDVCHPDSLLWNPINLYDYMISNKDVVYCPFAFGYVNYSFKNQTPHLKYAGIPGRAGSLLGGAGIAVSSKCSNVNAAIEYIKWICNPGYQKTKYVKEGGQPGQLSAWKEENVNTLTNNFFSNTLSTIESAYVRPRMPGWNMLQEYVGNVVHDFLLHNIDAEMIIGELNEAYKKTILQKTIF
jgi:multiple sugar transport system substrate-binding protein